MGCTAITLSYQACEDAQFCEDCCVQVDPPFVVRYRPTTCRVVELDTPAYTTVGPDADSYAVSAVRPKFVAGSPPASRAQDDPPSVVRQMPACVSSGTPSWPCEAYTVPGALGSITRSMAISTAFDRAHVAPESVDL